MGRVTSPGIDSPSSKPARLSIQSLTYGLAASAAVILSLPRFNFPYLYDDYDFLDRAARLHPRFFLPESDVLYYRPVSRELYFGLLSAFHGPLIGHVLNAILVALAVLLTAKLAERLAGPCVGMIAGLLLAAFSQWPVLVGWISGDQDLLAIDFSLVAMHMALRGRKLWMLVSVAFAILSKETAAVMVPVVGAILWTRGRSTRTVLPGILGLVGIGVCWALIHPGVRALIEWGAKRSAIGLQSPNRWGSLLASALTVLNVPLRFPTPWPRELTWAIAVASIPFLIALWGLRSGTEISTSPDRERLRYPPWAVGLLMAIPPLAFTSLFVRDWAPYYAGFIVLGISITLAWWLSKLSFRVIAGVLVFYLVIGVLNRGVSLEPGVTNERGLAPAAAALPTVEKNFKRLEPSLPGNSVVYVTIMAKGALGIYAHLHRFQALRVWYLDPTIQTLRPELHVLSSGPEFLFCVDPRLNVFEINVHTLAARSTVNSLDRGDYRSVLISYSIGLAGVGEIDRAVEILSAADEPSSPYRGIDRRIAAMLLLSRNEPQMAARLLQGLPDLPAGVAFESVGMLLTVPTRGVPLEEFALEAFGFSPQDPVVIRPLLKALMSLGYMDVSKRLAERLIRLDPGDREGLAAIAHIDSLSVSKDKLTHGMGRLE